MTDDREYVIWSFEHNAWRKPHASGYTVYLIEAARYSRLGAERLVRPQEWCLPFARAVAIAARGWHVLLPGAYDDGQGGLHLVLSELLAGHGYADTPVNREMLIEAASAMMPTGTVHVED